MSEYLTIGKEELGPDVLKGELVVCACGGAHPMQHGRNERGDEVSTVGYITCDQTGKGYLVSVDDQLIPGAKLVPMRKVDCEGCYNDDYNHGLGGAEECWCFKDARIRLRRAVGLDDVPPWTRTPELLPSCYRKTGYIFVDPETER